MLTRRIQAVLVPAVLGMIITQACDLRAADGPAIVRITDRGVPFSYAGMSSFTPSGGQIFYSSFGSNQSFFGWSGFGGNTHPPDYGWSRAGGNSVGRTPVQYRRYWPARWYGEPGSGLSPQARRFPVVYMPSDTTQLGVYYQRVPTWLPNPAMLPTLPQQGTCLSNGQCNGCRGGSTSEPFLSDPGSKATTPTPAPPPPPDNKSAANSNGVTGRF